VITVREAQSHDLPAIARQWGDIKKVAGRSNRLAPMPNFGRVRDYVRYGPRDPDQRVLVATIDGDDEVIGFCVLFRQPFAPLYDGCSVQVHYLHVAERCRRRGVGRALVAAAATFAEEVSAEHVVTNVYPQLRDCNRFFARLGFAPVITRRVVALPALRRRLAVEARTGSVDEVLARRRSVRRVRAALIRTAHPT
jgi:GNAT superfamily N-acetyltransferase